MYDESVKDPKPKSCEGEDALVAGPQLPNGFRPFIRHRADHSIQKGLMRPIQDGEPIHDGAFYLERRGDSEVYDVRDEFVMPKSGKGPAKVSTPAFRQGWDRIFGTKLETPEA